MLLVVAIFLAALMLAARRIKGPLWAFCIAWLICLVPLALGVIRFPYLPLHGPDFGGALLVFFCSFALGVWAYDHVGGPRREVPSATAGEDLRDALPWARVAWVASSLGTAFISVDYLLLEGVGLNDVAALRDAFVTRQATLYAQLGSVLTWGCLYCYAFAMWFKDQLSPLRFLTYVAPVAGYFLVAVFSAGRQAAMQILVFSLLVYYLKRMKAGQPVARRRERQRWLLPASMSGLMVLYMGLIAFARNDEVISADKTEVLQRLFEFELVPGLEAALMNTSQAVRSAFVEAIVYFSSSVALFSKFLTVELPELTHGVMTFPFVARQLEPWTGIEVLAALEGKVAMMNDAGVIGAGWTTAVSSYILDFGRVGACIALIVHGYYSAYTWWRVRSGMRFSDVVVAMAVLLSVIYLPMIPATSDTNILLLWAYSQLPRAFAWHATRNPHPDKPAGSEVSAACR